MRKPGEQTLNQVEILKQQQESETPMDRGPLENDGEKCKVGMNESLESKRILGLGRFTALTVFVCFFSSVLEGAPVVSERAGNIMLTEASGVERQLTSSGLDSDPVLNLDGNWVVFVRTLSGKTIKGSARDYPAAELWRIRVDGSEAQLLVRTRESDQMENLIAGFECIRFSTDGRMVYFVTPAWATSGAVHVVDTTNRKVRFLVPGQSVRVLPSGEYRDHLLVQQRRYFMGGGAYVWYYLFTPEGEQVGVVGEDTRDFMTLYVEGGDGH